MSNRKGPPTLGVHRGLAKRISANVSLAQSLPKQSLPEVPPLPNSPGGRRAVQMDFDICDTPGEFGNLLKRMRTKSGLSLPRLARKLDVSYRNLSRFLYTRRAGGSSTIKWFLRFAEATGCKVYMVFPTKWESDRMSDTPMTKTPTIKTVEGER
jgi:hypothetical protein